jgi:hypothetical protein
VLNFKSSFQKRGSNNTTVFAVVVDSWALADTIENDTRPEKTMQKTFNFNIGIKWLPKMNAKI